MTAFTSSVAAFIETRGRSFFTSHVEADLVAEIPPEMLHQLHRDSLRSLVALPLVMLGASTASTWLFPLDWIAEVAVYASMIAILILTLPATYRALLDREVKFRRLHGKWRWEK